MDSPSKLELPSFPTYVELLRERARAWPDLKVFTFLADGESEEQTLTYGELDRRARAVAAGLQQQGLSGQRAVLLYPPGLDFLVAFMGCLYAGVVAVPAYPPDPVRLARTLPRLQTIVADSRAEAVLCTSFVAQMAELLFETAPDLRAKRWVATDALPEGLETAWKDPAATSGSLAFLQYTSGSTSEPKGVMLTHGNLLHNSRLIAKGFGHSERSVGVIWLPQYHDMGLIGGILQPLYVGFHTVLMSPLDFLQRPVRWLQAISKYRGRTSGGPNFAYELCVRRTTPEERSKLDLSSWELAFTGAEPVRAQTLRRFAEAFAPSGFREEAFYPCYGLAEGTLIVTGAARGGKPVTRSFDKAGLEQGRAVQAEGDSSAEVVGCGRVIGEQQVRIVDPESGQERAPGEVGEIWVRGPSVAQGYWGKDEDTRRLFQARLSGSDEGPFLRTEDLGFLMDGELFVAGRRKDLIIVRGRNVHPQDIERVAEESHPALRQGGVAAFSVEVDQEERLVIAQEVDPRKQADLETVARDLRRAVLQQSDLPVHTVVLLKPGSIPKTSSGKIQRSRCRAAFLRGELEELLRSTPPMPASAGPGQRTTRPT